jgi:hypothetical protein
MLIPAANKDYMALNGIVVGGVYSKTPMNTPSSLTVDLYKERALATIAGLAEMFVAAPPPILLQPAAILIIPATPILPRSTSNFPMPFS